MVQGPASQGGDCPALPKSRVNVYQRTIHRACEMLGSVDALARHLGVLPAEIPRWIGGLEKPPLDKFLAAVDIVLLAADPGRGTA